MRAITIALCLLATPALADVAGPAQVIDGDTLEIHGQRIRLHGIDAPDSRQLCSLKGKRIYLVPGGQWYDKTRIDPAKGERWFCSEAEAKHSS